MTPPRCSHVLPCCE